MELGRKDGVVSSAAEAEALLPSSHSNAATLVASFAALGLTSRDMVTLSGKLWMYTHLILSKQTRVSTQSVSTHRLGLGFCSKFNFQVLKDDRLQIVQLSLPIVICTWLSCMLKFVIVCPMSANIGAWICIYIYILLSRSTYFRKSSLHRGGKKVLWLQQQQWDGPITLCHIWTDSQVFVSTATQSRVICTTRPNNSKHLWWGLLLRFIAR